MGGGQMIVWPPDFPVWEGGHAPPHGLTSSRTLNTNRKYFQHSVWLQNQNKENLGITKMNTQ